MTYKKKQSRSDNTPMSRTVLLKLGITRDTTNENIWNNNVSVLAKKCKENSLNSYSHHETKGFTYSFGNKLLYVNINGSSVSVYTNLKTRTQ